MASCGSRPSNSSDGQPRWADGALVGASGTASGQAAPQDAVAAAPIRYKISFQRPDGHAGPNWGLTIVPEPSVAQLPAAVHTVDAPLCALKEWGFDCLDLSLDQLVAAATLMFKDAGLLTEFCIPVSTMTAFAARTFSTYRKVPYHNMYHAFSVLQGCYALVLGTPCLAELPARDKLALFVAAIGHDNAHDGCTAAFHIAADSELAMNYNDISPLENMHARNTFLIMREPSCNIFANVDTAQRKTSRKSIVAMILATDMQWHVKKQRELESRKLQAGQSFDLSQESERQQIMETVLHAVDIGHPALSWVLESRWARLVATEFQAQVDRERAANLPVTEFMICTSETDLAKGQIGFFKFILPFFEACAKHILGLDHLVTAVKSNLQRYQQVASGSLRMPPVAERDSDIMSWSVTVGQLALGTHHPAIQQAKITRIFT